jgi:NAD(P)-dependent dehydrogenase (short-subunit alcohol dehydrogenase family)
VFNLTGKIAVVTGAGSGIGRAIATVFALQGAQLVALDIDEAAAAHTVSLITAEGGRANAAACDVTDASGVRAVFDAIVGRHTRVDILVNNAGIAHVGTIEQTGEADFDRVYRVNVRRVPVQPGVLPVMVRQGGGSFSIWPIISMIGVPGFFCYSMSKARF